MAAVPFKSLAALNTEPPGILTPVFIKYWREKRCTRAALHSVKTNVNRDSIDVKLDNIVDVGIVYAPLNLEGDKR